MKFLAKLRAELGVLLRARRNRTDLLRWIWRRPALAAAIGTYETALLASSRVGNRYKYLAALRASSRVGCPF